MTKCDFCTKYDPKKGCYFSFCAKFCYFSFYSSREPYCKEAIDRMTEALKNIGINIK